MSTKTYQIATPDDMVGTNESADVMDDVHEITKGSSKCKKEKGGSSKLATKIGSAVTKHNDKRLLSKDSIVMKFKMCPGHRT